MVDIEGWNGHVGEKKVHRPDAECSCLQCDCFRILTKFQDYNQVLGFRPNFKILTNFQDDVGEKKVHRPDAAAECSCLNPV